MTKNIDLEKIKELHSLGLTNRGIAERLGVHHYDIASRLKRLGLVTNGRRRGVREVSGLDSKCSVCGQWYPTESFPKGRSGRTDWYYLTYCWNCRKVQSDASLNSSIEKFLTNKFRQTRQRCKGSNIRFDLTAEFLIQQFESQDGRCFYTDTILVTRSGEGRSPNSASLDKIVPELGYTIGNVVWAANRINTMKFDATLSEMAEWMPGWYERIRAWRIKNDIE